MRHAETRLLKRSYSVIEIDETQLFSFIENGKCPGNPQPSPHSLMPSRLLIYQQYISMHLSCELNCLALTEIELRENETALRTKDFHPRRKACGPVLYGYRSERMLQLRQYSQWNHNSCVQPIQDVDLPDQDEVVDWRCVSDDD